MFPSKERGFMTFDRQTPSREAVEDRTLHWLEFESRMSPKELREQGYRCMDCGIPFCHQGCPLGNVIPDFNDAVKNGPKRFTLDQQFSRGDGPGVPRALRDFVRTCDQ